jgi:hypothetical protein
VLLAGLWSWLRLHKDVHGIPKDNVPRWCDDISLADLEKSKPYKTQRGDRRKIKIASGESPDAAIDGRKRLRDGPCNRRVADGGY